MIWGTSFRRYALGVGKKAWLGTGWRLLENTLLRLLRKQPGSPPILQV